MRLFEIIRRNPLKLPPSVPSQQYLYHGTQMPYLGSIVLDNALWQGGHWGKPNEPHGIRCTRSVEVAKDFAFEQEMPGGILVLDWYKIVQHWKTIPHIDTMYNDNDRLEPGEPWSEDEQEEVVLARFIKPLNQFLVSILMQSKELQELKAGEFLADEWIESYTDWSNRFTTPRGWRRAIQALMAYPNIKTIA